MMYRQKLTRYNMLGLLVFCGSLFFSSPEESYAGKTEPRPTPLKVFIPNISSAKQPNTVYSYIVADSLEYNPETYVILAKGNIVIEQDDMVVMADYIEYDQKGGLAKAYGNVAIAYPDGRVVITDQMELNDSIKSGIGRGLRAELAADEIFAAAGDQNPSIHVSKSVALSDRSKESLSGMFYNTAETISIENKQNMDTVVAQIFGSEMETKSSSVEQKISDARKLAEAQKDSRIQINPEDTKNSSAQNSKQKKSKQVAKNDKVNKKSAKSKSVAKSIAEAKPKKDKQKKTEMASKKPSSGNILVENQKKSSDLVDNKKQYSEVQTASVEWMLDGGESSAIKEEDDSKNIVIAKAEEPEKSFFSRIFDSVAGDAANDKNLSELAPAAGGEEANTALSNSDEPIISLAEQKPIVGEIQKSVEDVQASNTTDSVEGALDSAINKPVTKSEETTKEPSKFVEPAVQKPTIKTDNEVKSVANEAINDDKNEKNKPEKTVSQQTRNLLDNVTPKVARENDKNKKPKKINVEHTKDMQDLFKANESASSPIKHESLGAKVERRNRRINIDYELDKAYNAINSGQNEAAIETYKDVLENSPNNTQALFGLATIYHRTKQLDKARSLYSRLLNINPQHRDGFNNFLVLLADEAPKEAISELERLEEKNPGFSTIPAQLAVIYQKLGDTDKAIDKMYRATALAPENLIYRYNLAIMLDKQKNYDEAARLYRELIEAVGRGEKIPGNVSALQQRLTFISSNRP